MFRSQRPLKCLVSKIKGELAPFAGKGGECLYILVLVVGGVEVVDGGEFSLKIKKFGPSTGFPQKEHKLLSGMWTKILLHTLQHHNPQECGKLCGFVDVCSNTDCIGGGDILRQESGTVFGPL